MHDKSYEIASGIRNRESPSELGTGVWNHSGESFATHKFPKPTKW